MDARVGLLTSSLIRRPASMAAPRSTAPLLAPLGCFCRALSPAGRWLERQNLTRCCVAAGDGSEAVCNPCSEGCWALAGP